MPDGGFPHRVVRLVVVAGFLGAIPADAADCAAVLEAHGFLRWASNRCGFDNYDPGLVEDARRCFTKLGDAAAPLMYAGRDQFDRTVARRDLQSFCAEIAKRFRDTVR